MTRLRLTFGLAESISLISGDSPNDMSRPAGVRVAVRAAEPSWNELPWAGNLSKRC